MSEFGLNVAVVGATGAVGQELLHTLARAPFPIAGLNAIASPGSTQPTVEFRDHDVPVRNLEPEALEGVDLLFTAQPLGVGEELLQEAVDAGVVVVDLAYVPGSATRLVREVRAAGAVAIDGREVLLAQAIPQSLTMTGERLSEEQVRDLRDEEL